MIKEEYAFSDIADYLYKEIDLLIVGYPTNEERSVFFKEEWNALGGDVLLVKREDAECVRYCYMRNNRVICEQIVDLCIGMPRVLRAIKTDERSVLLDMSSLDNVLIMFFTKQLLTKVTPRALFASYIRPESYINQSGDVGSALSEQLLAVEAVPGFAKRENKKQTLCAFLGFEGIRLKSVLETIHVFDRLIPIVAFPSGSPEWYNVTMWNSMDVIQSEARNLSVYKCFSESVFDAVELLNETISQYETVVLAPLGTRVHSMACAIFACQHQATRIVYDFAIEHDHRAIGIAEIRVYHLSSFIQ